MIAKSVLTMLGFEEELSNHSLGALCAEVSHRFSGSILSPSDNPKKL
jgi:hypothetical protein